MPRYLPLAEYLYRFGEAETTRLTAEAPGSPIDTLKVESAIEDSEEEADGYIGTRYSVPLVDVPRIVLSIVAALARERLHKTRPTPEVKEAADRARSQLRDISLGRLSLPVATGDAAPDVLADRESLTSGDRPSDRFAEQLDDFSNFRTGFYNPCWRQ